MNSQTVVVAGATGNLGTRIVKALRQRNARVVALTRVGSDAAKVETLRTLGAEIATVDLSRVDDVATACTGASCVVSALLGLRETIVDTQTALLNGAVKASVSRFIPSDYSLDFTRTIAGENRNLDLHREFLERLSKAPIAATSILNGMFMELLTGPAPFILFKLHRTLYWGNADQPLDFTTMDNVAEFTAAAALDVTTPRLLKISGERASARQLAAMATEVTGEKFKPQWAGSIGSLGVMIKLMRTLMPATNDPFPPWQGMQYSRDMFSGRGLLEPLDNARYSEIAWTPIRDVLAKHPLSD